jgi:hypothetical protein
MLWYDLGIVTVSSATMVGKNMDSELGNTMLFAEGEKYLIAQGLV